MFAKFETKYGEIERVRKLYESAVDLFGRNEGTEELFAAFAQFEELCKEPERARCIYEYALDNHDQRGEMMHQRFISFERRNGDRERVEAAIIRMKRFQFEVEFFKDPFNYDKWFDYVKLEQNGDGDRERIGAVYERAIGTTPLAQEKRYWQPYIYLGISYALYEDLDAKDVDRARHIYNSCNKTIPYKIFSFSKIWISAAEFELRQLDLTRARRILGSAIGMAPKDKKVHCCRVSTLERR